MNSVANVGEGVAMPGAQDRWGHLAEPSAGSPRTSAADLPQRADRPERGSLEDLRQRLERLPPGHPSSPYNDDLTLKPPVARLKALELPLHGNEPAASEPNTNGAARRSAPEPAEEVQATARAETASANGAGIGAAGWASTTGRVSYPDPMASGRNGLTSGLGRSASAPDDPADGFDRLAADDLDDEPASLRDGTDLTDGPDRLAEEPAASADDFADDHDGTDDDLAGTTSGWRSVTGSFGGPADELGGASGRRTGSSDHLTTSSWAGSSPRLGGSERLTTSDRPAASARLSPPPPLPTRRSPSGWDGTSGWRGLPDDDGGPHDGGHPDNGAGTGWADPEPSMDTLAHAVINVERAPRADEPMTGPDGSWEWNGRYLTPEEGQIADQALGRCRIAEGRNVFGGYGHSGLTPAMRRIEAQLEHGQLLPDTEGTALKSADSFKEKLADLILRHPDKSADDLALEVHDGIRYAFIIEPEHYAETTLQTHSRLKGNGFELEVRRNCWHNPEYKGINTRWRDPAHDLVFEAQFHTARSWELRQRAHALYEAITDPATAPAERERLRGVYAQMSDGVPIPPGCAAIPDYRKEGQ
jgi:hypothetical protein